MRKDYTVKQLCNAIGVSSSGYYESLKRPVQETLERDIKDVLAIQELYDKSGGTYRAKRIAGELSAKGHIVNHKRVARLMKEMNIKSKIRVMKSKKRKKSEVRASFIPTFLNAILTLRCQIENG